MKTSSHVLFLILLPFFVNASVSLLPPQDSTYYYDFDSDGYGNPSISVTVCCAAPQYYVSNKLDCNDNISSIHPGTFEICDGYDNDCDGLVDQLIDWGPTWYLDADADGFGNPAEDSLRCTQPTNYVNNGVDCNDNNNMVGPGNIEICNGLDDDCSGLIDDNIGDVVYYQDNDADGYGNPIAPKLFCTDFVQAGYVDNSLDCDDTNADVNQEAIWYHDADGDGYGATDDNVTACTPPTQYTLL